MHNIHIVNAAKYVQIKVGSFFCLRVTQSAGSSRITILSIRVVLLNSSTLSGGELQWNHKN